MIGDLDYNLRDGLPLEDPVRLRYPHHAFEMLPPFDRPRVLDAGCGPAMSTLEQVQLGGEQVIGTDIDRPSL